MIAAVPDDTRRTSSADAMMCGVESGVATGSETSSGMVRSRSSKKGSLRRAFLMF